MPPRIQPNRGRGQPAARTAASAAGRGRGAAGELGSGGAESISAHVETVGVRRPAQVGTGGRAVTIRVNAFEAKVTDEVIRHYDAIDDDKLPPRVNMALWVMLMEKTAPEVFAQGKIPFDGRKNAYATYDLPLGPNNSGTFQIQTAPTKEGKAPKLRSVKITKVAEINTELLHRFIAGKQSQDNAVSTAIMALNVAIQMEPKRSFPFNVRSFFTPDSRQEIGKGLELWRGYFQSIRPAVGKMYVNVDIATALMYKPGPVITSALEHFNLGLNAVNNLKDYTMGNKDRERLTLSRFLMGARIKLTYTARETTIKGISTKTPLTARFQDREGNTITVADYFKKLMGRPLQFPNIPCIEAGNGALIPMEVCHITPGQFCRRSLPSDKTTDMVNFSKTTPAVRLDLISQKGRNLLAYGQSEYVRQFGIDIATNVMEVKARILDPPTIRYASAQSTVKPYQGAWNLRDQKFIKPAEIGDWAIVVFDHRAFKMEDAQAMAADFTANAKILGIKFTSPRGPLIEYKNPQNNIPNEMKAVGKKMVDATKRPPTFMIAVLPDMGNADVYTGVKHFGDILMGVPTQCLKAQKCKRAKPQYWANVLLKVNAKLGGTNSILERDPLVDPNFPTMVMGADVKHPSPGTEGRPSYAALVASIDAQCSRYTAISRAQTGRQEIISDLKEMVLEAFGVVRAVQGKPPTRIIFYRDGVSEGQFAQVLQDEVPLIKEACEIAKIKAKLTFIIVGKRHHIRFFPDNLPANSDKTGNCIAGTTVDTGITHSTEFDYYQLTHGGLLGTSRPAHYSVLVDENKFTADGLQKISFALCHVYARATRSVSIPAPVYYADIVCARSATHYDPMSHYNFSDSGTQAGGIDGLQKFKEDFKKLHQSMTQRMYFM